ncbi:hypothetical protein KM043_012870 [Ampulex compressa]|nr:hypothetical protein KM043_012870 [Ampulex compressa]
MFDESEANDPWQQFACPEYVIRTCPESKKRLGKILGTERYTKVDLVRHLPAVMNIIEFLAWKSREVKQYRTHLDRMLELCRVPPLLERCSDTLVSSDVMEQYFTLLGYLLAILPTKREASKIHEALYYLLIRTGPVNEAAVKLEYRRLTMEKSRLPITVTELLEASFPAMYPKILELVFLLVSVSYTCCYRMLDTGILNTLLIRMDLPYATQLRCTKPPDIALEGEEYSEATMLLIMNIIWCLMKSILEPKKLPDCLKRLSAPVQCAMWGLRYSFKRQIRYGQRRASSLRIRNEIAVFILTGLIALPSWNVVGSGIADDIIHLLAEIESDTVTVWTEKMMLNRKVMHAVLQFINPQTDNYTITWNEPKCWHLVEYALSTLSALTPKIPEEFIKYGGTIRLIAIIDQLSRLKFDNKVALNCADTICSIILAANTVLLNDLRKHGMTIYLMRLAYHILEFDSITAQFQLILTYLLIGIEGLMKKQRSLQEIYKTQNITLIMSLSHKYIVEISTYPVRCLFLGILTDICDDSFCGQYLCTWRGADKKTGLMSLLAMVWREEEIRLRVRRHSDGSMEDIELPQMGTKQWMDTYRSKLLSNVSPTLIDMIGSVRSKIYSIRQIIEREHEKYEFARNRYKILLHDLPIEDRITMSCVELYFRLKLGQMWTEIYKYLEQVGITPSSMDGQVMFLMMQRHRSWGMFIQEQQKKLVLSVKNAEELREKQEYARIRDSKLQEALEAFEEVDYIRRTTDRSYLLERKENQRKRVNANLCFPRDADKEHCHRTFQDRLNVTAIFDQHCSIPSTVANDSNLMKSDLPPVSPSTSSIFSYPQISDDSSNTTITHDYLFEQKRARWILLFGLCALGISLTNAEAESSYYTYGVPTRGKTSVDFVSAEFSSFIQHDELLRERRATDEGSNMAAAKSPQMQPQPQQPQPTTTTEPAASSIKPEVSKPKTNPVVVSQPMNPTGEQAVQPHVWPNRTMTNMTDKAEDGKNATKVTELTPVTEEGGEKEESVSEIGDISISKFSDVTNKTLSQNNITKTEFDTHQYYNSTFIIDEAVGKKYWVDLDNHPELKVNTLLSQSYRRAATVKLKFDFPFYGHKVRNITIATGGFLYTGEYVHSWLAATQYIAPLMANFDTRLSDNSRVKYADNGTAVTVEWEKVALQDKPKAGAFTFQVTLHQNGDIVFVYSAIPLMVEDIEDTAHPVKVGISDAFIMDRTVFFVRRKTIYEYHRVNFNQQDIKNWTVIYLHALPTCLEMDNCKDCLTKLKKDFDCKWCSQLNQCSTGMFRSRQDWLLKGCDVRNIRDVGNCSATSNTYKEHQEASGIHTHTEETATASEISVKQERPGGSSPLERTRDNMNMGVLGIIGILVVVALVVGLAGWGAYAYRNPHSASGQMLIRYRPSQWSWRRGEARYTAATIHM